MWTGVCEGIRRPTTNTARVGIRMSVVLSNFIIFSVFVYCVAVWGVDFPPVPSLAMFCSGSRLMMKMHAPTATPTRTTTTADTTPIMPPTLIPLLDEGGEGVGLGGNTVAGFASTVALDNTAQLGTEALANCVLMFVTVRAAAVAVA